jgi:hypothetical protein
MNLAYCELLGNANLINTETDLYLSVTIENIKQKALEIFTNQNSSTLIYHPKK